VTPSAPSISPRQRKSTGAYYTPPALVDLLLAHALPARTDRPLRILDPSCGAGDFLAAARARRPDAELFGVDIDPAALAGCGATLASPRPSGFVLHHSDALLSPPPFLRPQGFDLILGNPPFVNAIEHHLTPAYKNRLREAFPGVRGAADLAHYFLDQATRLVRPGGRIAFVLPRAILKSPHLRPNLIYAPERSNFFPGAAIFICLLILGPEEGCAVSTDPDPASATFRNVCVTGDNWWSALFAAASVPPSSSSPPASSILHRPSPSSAFTAPTLASRFEVSASMTAAEAYDLFPHLTDAPEARGLKFVTTGLIDPRACLWGATPCRYLKRDFRHPRLMPADTLPRSLARRAQNARRPKILVAGLAKRIEAFLDPVGQYIGAVSTYTIHHPTDDVAALAHLLEHLLAPATTQHLILHLGANGLRGRHITVKKSFLRDLPLPSCEVTSDPLPE
jgi:SAM-dependent methyltransferase